MDESEQVAKNYLCKIGFKKVVYEPDGNIPPDFLADDRVAVEVRRLNQNEMIESGSRGLEESAIPLRMKVDRLLSSFGPPTSETSWFVHYRFRRPLLSWDHLELRLRHALQTFMHDQCADKSTSISIAKGFELQLIRASSHHDNFFVLGGYIDSNNSGFVGDLLLKNLRICIEEKTRKIAPHRRKHSEWWLVLIDRITYGVVDEHNAELLRKHINSNHGWHKIVLLNPLDYGVAFEIR